MLYFHLGLHKTGTTSFQYSCIQNRHLLFDIGIDYPEDKSLTLGGAQHLALAHCWGNIQDIVKLIKYYENSDVIFSCEEIINSFYELSNEDILNNLNWLNKKFDGLTIILSTRDDRQLATSLIHQSVEMSNFYGLREFLPEYKKKIAKIMEITKEFPLKVINIDEKFIDMSLASYFIFMATGKKIILPEIVTNVTNHKSIEQYFLGAFRPFYSNLLNLNLYDEKINDRCREITKHIQFSAEFKYDLYNEMEKIIFDVVDDFFEKEEFLMPINFGNLRDYDFKSQRQHQS